MLKTRLFGLVLVILFAGMIYYGWYQLREEGVYYMKMAAFSPLGVVGGLFLMLFPNMGGKPETTKQKIIVMVVLGGMGSLVGSVIGATVLTALREALRFASSERLIIYSLLLIVLMIARPQGILGKTEGKRGK